MSSVGINPGAPPNPTLFTTIYQAQSISNAMMILYGEPCPYEDMNPAIPTTTDGKREWGVAIENVGVVNCGLLITQQRNGDVDAKGNPSGNFQKDPNGQPYWVSVIAAPPAPTPLVPGTTTTPFPGFPGDKSLISAWTEPQIQGVIRVLNLIALEKGVPLIPVSE